jgi:collagenase-like PrtC family protease
MIKITAPVYSPEDIEIISQTGCNSVYLTSSYLKKTDESFFLNIFEQAKKHKLNFFIKFKKPETEKDEKENIQVLESLSGKPIDGIFVNSIGLLSHIKDENLKFNVIIDSGLNIHNMSAIDFLNKLYPVDKINLTEEIYIRNLSKIKQYAKCKVYIDADNLPWIADDITKNKAVDYIILKGDLKKSKTLFEGISAVEKIIKEKGSKDKAKLPFKYFENSSYRTNHFSGEFQSPKGKAFKFTGNIQQFNWKYKRFNYKKPALKDLPPLPRLNVRLTNLEQFKTLKNHIKALKFNPIYSVEYGEILSTSDLAKNSFNKIIEKVKKDCERYNIQLFLSTPKILIERDFERVNDYIKQLCIDSPRPQGIIINNLGLLWSILNDVDFEDIKIELGQGLSFLGSDSLLCLSSFGKIDSMDFSNYKNVEDMKTSIQKVENKIKNRKLTVAGNIRLPASGLCPLNNDPAILSRLSCYAPCHHGSYAISDPVRKKLFPVAVDGFCRMHLFEEKVLDLFKYIPKFAEAGINEFSIDFSGLTHKLIPVLINRYLKSIQDKDYVSDENFVQDYYNVLKSCEKTDHLCRSQCNKRAVY